MLSLVRGKESECEPALNKGKAFLYIEGSEAPQFNLLLEGAGTTGIENVKGETVTNNGYYNLNGQRVAQPTKGLYIVNGRVVVIK